MKICTDALLFGAMAPVKGGEKVLDIGAGTGVLSLMAIQLGAAHATAVELAEPAYREAGANFSASPWPERLSAHNADIRHYAPRVDTQYDLIISNPPFFENHLQAFDADRNHARHTGQLAYAELIEAVERLLAREGLFYLLLPVHAVDKAVRLAEASGLFLHRYCEIRAFDHSRAKVAALTFGRTKEPATSTAITVYEAPNVYSRDSAAYLSRFLLRFAEAAD